MAPSIALICETCGHFKENHSARMGCMVQGQCNFDYTHYCNCENFKEMINVNRKEVNEVDGQTL